eukprot:1150502-Pelagomonas_calceolata.AAC.4
MAQQAELTYTSGRCTLFASAELSCPCRQVEDDLPGMGMVLRTQGLSLSLSLNTDGAVYLRLALKDIGKECKSPLLQLGAPTLKQLKQDEQPNPFLQATIARIPSVMDVIPWV